MHLRILFLITLLLGGSATVSAENWTTLNGTNFEAKFLGMWGQAAIFRRADGKRAAIPMNGLNAESRIAIGKLNKEVMEKRAKRISQLKEQKAASIAMKAAEGGAPVELPPVVAYEPMSDVMTLEETVQHMINQSASGHIRTYWDTLPENYQTDMEGIRGYLTSKVPAEKWDMHIDVASKFSQVLNEKKDLILGLPLFAALPPPMAEPIKNAVPSLGTLVSAFADKNFLSHDALSKMELSQIIEAKSTEMNGSLRAMMESGSMPANVPPLDAIEISMDGDDRGTVAVPNAPPQTWLLVEGRWVPESMAGDWDGKLEKMRESIDKLAESDSTTIDMIMPLLDQLLAAQDQQTFSSTIQGAMTQLMPLMQSMPGFSGGPGLGAGGMGQGFGPPPGMGAPGMGSPKGGPLGEPGPPGPGGPGSGVPPGARP